MKRGGDLFKELRIQVTGSFRCRNLYKKLRRCGIKIEAGVGEVVAPSSSDGPEGEESPNSKGQDGR
jgi:hypothetical protein